MTVTELGPGSWGLAYKTGFTPWDLGRPHPALLDRLEADRSLGLGEPGSAFVPGAGRGWDAKVLAQAGWQVTAVDFASGILEAIPADVIAAGVEYLSADAFEFAGGPFDLIYDYTFFCAIPPSRRPDVGAMADRLLSAPGRYAAVVYPIGKDPDLGGPPHGVTVGMYQDALGPGFTLADLGDRDCLLDKSHEYRWAMWERA